MAKSAVYGDRGQTGEVSINMTPMIDCVFQLLLFFLIGAQMVTSEISSMELPTPYEGRSVPEQKIKERRIIVNILSKEDPQARKPGEKFAPGDLARYEVRGQPVAGADAMTQLKNMIEADYKEAQARREEFHVEIRADYRVAYDHVARALVVAGMVGVEKANLTVNLVNPGGAKEK
jgi:biopolymer transport protein ExbD